MTKPEIELSDLYIHLSIEAGTSYDGSFHIYSRNGQELSGKVLSTNDKIVVERKELSGTECEIPFYFKGKKGIAGEEHAGDFLLLTNGGEYNIPFCFSIVPKKLRVQDHILFSLSDFGKFAREHWEKAKEIFFTKEFHDVFLEEKEEIHELYHELLKGQSKDVILDHFLMEVLGKKEALLLVEEKELLLKEGKGKIQVSLQGWGNIEGKIYGKHGNLILSKDTFGRKDFMEEYREDTEERKRTCSFGVALKEGTWEDVLVFETVYQHLEIPVKEVRKRSLAPLTFVEKKKECFPVLLRHYVDFRTGKISFKEYKTKSLEAFCEQGHFYDLYKFQLLMLSDEEEMKAPSGQKTEEIGEETGGAYALQKIQEELEEKRSLYLRDDFCRSYYYYVMALYHKDRAFLMEASMQIKEQFEKTGDYRDYLLLTLVEESHAGNYGKQCEILGKYKKAGVKSPLLYIALLDALEKEPYYLEKLVGIRSDLMLWGIKHQYLSLELARHFAVLVQKEKYFSKSHWKVLLKLYEIKPDTEFLKAICSLLIKGNRTDLSCHRYFQDALSRELKIVGVNEYFLRTLDFDTYPALPKNLLYYFYYSNSLDKRERAYLYLNVLKNREAYGELWENYRIRMESFVLEQMMEGRMNRYLCQLYDYFLPRMQERKDWMKHLPGILFKKKMYCENPLMEGVCIRQGEKEETFVPFVEGACQIEIYSEEPELYFVDDRRNRYHIGISYQIVDYLQDETYRDVSIKYCGDNHKVRLRWFTKSARDMGEYLEETDYQRVKPAYRRALMNHYMEQGRMEDAYFGAELYGSDLMDGNQLYLLTCVGLYLHKEEKDDLLLTMAHRSFLKKKYNKEILLYLREHLEGRSFDLLALWEVLKREGMDTAEYEERMLEQLLLTGEWEERMLDVLLSYLEKRENDVLTVSMLEVYSIYYFMGRRKVPESYFAILDRQARRENGLSFASRLSYLLRKAEKGYDLSEREWIGTLVEELCKKQMVFDFFDSFSTFVSISPLLKEMTGFYFFGEEGKTYELKLSLQQEEGERRELELGMEEIYPGFYYGKTLLFPEETVRKRQLLEGKEEVQGLLKMTKMTGTVKESRYDMLCQMGEEGTTKQLEQYDRILARMSQQLRLFP